MSLNVVMAPSVAPIGSKLTINENGEYNVTDYAVADVNVEGGGGSWQTVFEGSVTTESESTFANGDIVGLSSLDGDSVKVTFNGVEYTLPKHELGYGEMGEGNTPDFSNYPLFIETSDTPYLLYTQTAGTYSLKIEEQQSGGSSDFSTARVTILNASGDLVTFSPFARILGDEIDASPYNVMSVSTPQDCYAVLYRGQTYITFDTKPPTTENIATEGGVEYNESDGTFIVTGDCTITIS